MWLFFVFAVLKADTEEQNKAVVQCGVDGSIRILAFISLLLSIQKLNVKCFYVLVVSDLTTDWGIWHLSGG